MPEDDAVFCMPPVGVGGSARRTPLSSTTPAYDPATANETGWWRGSYSASPWVGTASTGSSGSRDLTEATNPPTAGAAVNGFTPASYNGTNQLLSNATAISSYFTASAYLWWCLYYASSSGASTFANAGVNPCAWADTGSYIGCTFTASGGEKVQVWHWNGSYLGNEHPHTLGAYHLICTRFDGTNIRSKLDSNAVVVSGAAGNIGLLTGTILTGKNSSGVFCQLRNLDMGFRNTAGADADFDDIRAYVNARYALAL